MLLQKIVSCILLGFSRDGTPGCEIPSNSEVTTATPELGSIRNSKSLDQAGQRQYIVQVSCALALDTNRTRKHMLTAQEGVTDHDVILLFLFLLDS